MAFPSDVSAFYVDGESATLRPAAGGAPVTGRVILDQPGANLFNGSVSTTDYTLRYPTATFPVSRGDRFTIGGADYLASAAPSELADGLEATVTLAKL